MGQHRSFAYQSRGDTFLNAGLRKEAIADYESALQFDRDNSDLLNKLAWLLATAPNDELRNGTKSLELALNACDLTNYRQATILSTLAAAYAETGRFDLARSWLQKSIEAADESVKEQLRKQLAGYEKGAPWRDGESSSANEQ